jgi:hypothetical protein
LNTVERRKIRSGSSAATAGPACHIVAANTVNDTAKAKFFHELSYLPMALNVISISAEGLCGYVMFKCRTGRLRAAAASPRLTECEAFLLRLGRKAPGLGTLALVNAFRLCDNK